MTIHSRLTLWYSGILLVSLGIMAGVLHYEWAEQQERILVDHQDPEPAWQEAGEVVLYYGLPSMLLVLVGGGWLLRRALAPLRDLTRAVERIHLNNLQERLPVSNRRDELSRFAELFNAMMTRLEDAVGRVREFTLHASHELKTPLTVMRAEIESALREGACPADQQEVYANQLDEIARLTRIVDGLTLLAKADAGQAVLCCEPVRLAELVKDSHADAQVMARPQGISVELAACDEVVIQGDRHRLRQMLLNLTDNAIKYNQPDGRVAIALHAEPGGVELTIGNTGAGIPPANLPRVFDRFFRGDPAHLAAVEGCGLGLSIVQWIVRAHGGTLAIASEPDRWTSVVVHFPIPAAA